MGKRYKILHKKIDTRLSLWVLGSVAILFVAALTVMFRFSHKAVEEESLEKAEETLKGTTQRIENMLHRVEVATMNMRWNAEHHLDDKDAIVRYTREIVKNNPNIIGCAIAMDPKSSLCKGEPFMVYSFRTNEGSDSVVTHYNPGEIEPGLISSVPYMGHTWYFIPMRENATCWVRPHAPGETTLSSIVTCSMPIHDEEGRPVGVLASDIKVDWLSNTILNTKPYPNSYCAMLGVQGTYLIHPDSTRLYQQLATDAVKDESDPRVKELVESMLAGESGCRAVNLFGKDSYVLYQSLNNGHWNACIVCPESDIFAANQQLLGNMIAIAVGGLVLLFVCCMLFFRRQLKPLNMLAESAQRLAEGDYSTTIPATSRKDEIGTLQNSFSFMQSSLSQYIDKINQMAKVLKEQNESLIAISSQVQEGERMKMTVIHSIADKMIPPAIAIDGAVSELKAKKTRMKEEEIPPISKRVMKNVEVISDLLDEMARVS